MAYPLDAKDLFDSNSMLLVAHILILQHILTTDINCKFRYFLKYGPHSQKIIP